MATWDAVDRGVALASAEAVGGVLIRLPQFSSEVCRVPLDRVTAPPADVYIYKMKGARGNSTLVSFWKTFRQARAGTA